MEYVGSSMPYAINNLSMGPANFLCSCSAQNRLIGLVERKPPNWERVEVLDQRRDSVKYWNPRGSALLSEDFSYTVNAAI